MRVAAAFISTVAVVQAFVPENAFRLASKSNDVMWPIRATHYDSIVETRQVAVSLVALSCAQRIFHKFNLITLFSAGTSRRNENAEVARDGSVGV